MIILVECVCCVSYFYLSSVAFQEVQLKQGTIPQDRTLLFSLVCVLSLSFLPAFCLIFLLLQLNTGKRSQKTSFRLEQKGRSASCIFWLKPLTILVLIRPSAPACESSCYGNSFKGKMCCHIKINYKLDLQSTRIQFFAQTDCCPQPRHRVS